MITQGNIDKLIEHGAAIHLLTPVHPSITMLLAAASLLTNPTRLRWCALFPEDQHHVHETHYATNDTAAGGRDIAFHDRSGELVAYLCPFEECGLNLAEAKDAFVDWRNDHDPDIFKRFFNEA